MCVCGDGVGGIYSDCWCRQTGDELEEFAMRHSTISILHFRLYFIMHTIVF